MKKSLRVIVLLQISFILNGQNLKNTEWTKINAERKDGSKIVDHSGLDQGALVYLFKESSVSIVSGGQYSFDQKYSIRNRILTIGDFQNYSIDTVNNMMLVLTEIPSRQLTDDRINRISFINSRLYLNYLIQSKQVRLISDTLIQCNDKFSPTYNKGSLDQLLISKFQPIKVNTVLIGNFILTPSGSIMNVRIMQNETLSKDEVDVFVETLRQTSGGWNLPKGGKSLHFKVDFICRFMYQPPLSSIMFTPHTQDSKIFEMTGLTLKQKSDADEHFNKGVQLLSKEKHEKAVIEFTKCIDIDSLYLDAYYNRAYSYIKLGDKKLACESWSKLKAMGQKQGELLFRENCN